MGDPVAENSYKKAKYQAEKFYKKIGYVWCSALHDHVVFNRAGFRHLMRKGKIWRPKSEQKRRFALLPFVEMIIENPAAHFTTRQGSNVTFWSFSKQDNNERITLIIRQVGNGKKHFFSIF